MITKAVLGFSVTDVVCGFTGIATSWHETFTGNDQIGITPKSTKDNTKSPAPMIFDVRTIQVNADKPVILAVSPVQHDLSLGDEVNDILTGFKGKIAEFVTFVNGCVHVVVLPEADKKSEFPTAKSLPVQRIHLIKKMKEKPPEIKTGGPARRLRDL